MPIKTHKNAVLGGAATTVTGTLKKNGACFSLSPVPMLVTVATLDTPFSFMAVMTLLVPWGADTQRDSAGVTLDAGTR